MVEYFPPGERWNLPDRVYEVWFKVVSSGLRDDRELKIAYERAIAERSFLPTPNEFVALVRGDRAMLQEFQIAEDWERITTAFNLLSAPRHEREEFYSSLSTEGRWALEKLGGLRSLGNVPPDQLDWKLKRFEHLFKVRTGVIESLEQHAILEESDDKPSTFLLEASAAPEFSTIADIFARQPEYMELGNE
jgi:hypothetical protein